MIIKENNPRTAIMTSKCYIYNMKKFFITNGSWLTMALTLIFFMTDLIGDYLPKFSNIYITLITYFIIVMIPVSLSIYYNNKK